MLLSGGVDPTIKVWDWMSGELLTDIPIEETVNPFIVVKAPKGKRGWAEDGDDEQQRAEKPGRRRGKGRRKGATGTEHLTGDEKAADVEAGEQDSREETPETRLEISSGQVGEQTTGNAQSVEETERVVLALHRIDSVDLASHGRYFVFNAVG